MTSATGRSMNQKCYCAIAVAILVCSMGIHVMATFEHSRNYRAFISQIRALVSEPYRCSTRIMSGSPRVSYVSMDQLIGDTTNVALIISHSDLSLLGYRLTFFNGQRHVFLFRDTPRNVTANGNCDHIEVLPFPGLYQDLELYAGLTRAQVQADVFSIQAAVQVLQQLPNANTHKARAQAMLMFILVSSEAARFHVIADDIQNNLHRDSKWRPTAREVALTNAWTDISGFIVETSQGADASTSRYFPRVDETINITTAIAMVAIVSRCFQTSDQKCRTTVGVGAALFDTIKSVYFFKGPNYAFVTFTHGTTDTQINMGVRSLLIDWTYLNGTVFENGWDDCFREPDTNNAYLFKGPNYVLIDIKMQRIIKGPDTIYNNWPSFRNTVFVNGIDTIFPTGRKNEVYIFRGDQYAKVNYAPEGRNDKVNPGTIKEHWPIFNNTVFEDGIDAAFSIHDLEEAYFFKGDTYVLVKYTPGKREDKILKGPLKTVDGWRPLRDTPFEVYV